MATELAKIYDPKAVEGDIYQRWLDSCSFHAEPDGQGRKAYSIVIPPPNVTAALHLGHALNNTLQDILIRWKRMAGFDTLWMPGTDHAGIATQTVVEKRILAEEGKRRTDFAREDFIARVQAWKDQYEARILGQLKAMGCSCDWDRTRFTMDDMCAQAVRAAFFKLFADGLIYRGKRLVNWDPATQTVLADDEVEYETVQGHFWYMRYPLTAPAIIDGQEVKWVTVATTRPETMLGDTAVAMNPRDPRAKALVGKFVRLPLVGREIPIIADEYVVLPDPDSEDAKARFATGFLKVTPAHDPNDYAIGQRHDLRVINVMAPDGSISDKFGWDDAKGTEAAQFIGMDRFKARKAIVAWFEQNELLEDVRDYAHEIGHSYRSHVPIEPYLSDQWYIAVKKPVPGLPDKGVIAGTDVPATSLAGLALTPLHEGRLKFTPDRYANNYRSWLENLRDWPISRQLWWGHQIPVWSSESAAHQADLAATLKDRASVQNFQGKSYICLRDPRDAEAQKLIESKGYAQDPDVLDTWFSSALWPISTMGWPEETPLLETFYPTSLLCTAREILTLWVSRMVMFGQYFRGDIPFRDVYIHAMIQDGEGRKMSKSLGNGIDPLDIIDSHGADAMRFTLAGMATETQDVRMPVAKTKLPDGRELNTSPKFDLGRNFCNKLWNASRFALLNIEGLPSWGDVHPHSQLADAWILSRLHSTIRDATAALEQFRYSELANVLYRFTWDDFCDWYLEIAKGRINAGDQAPKAIVAYVLDNLLRLLQPVAPFITEAIWQQFNAVAPRRGLGDQQAEPLLVSAAWPLAMSEWINPGIEAQFDVLRDLVRGIREVRTSYNVPPSRLLDLAIRAEGADAQLIKDNAELISSQARLASLAIAPDASKPDERTATVAIGRITMFIADVVDLQAEKVRLVKERDTLAKGIASVEGKLKNEKFVQNARPAVVEAERNRLAEMHARRQAIEQALAQLG